MELNEIKEKLLKLSDIEKKERKEVKRDYLFYQGKSFDLEAAKSNDDLLGQNWKSGDNVDYTPTQDIRNKVKPLLKKQSRFMFGKEPTLTFKPDNLDDKEICDELRLFIDDILSFNKFWKKTRKAFLMSTIEKRVLLRAEVNPNSNIRLKYERIDNFSYEEYEDELLKVTFFEEDSNNVFAEKDDDKRYILHTYYYGDKDTVRYKKDVFNGAELDKPIQSADEDTGLDSIPCWLIKNGGELDEDFGESDIRDLVDPQNQYNRKISDAADALKFQMFGSTSVIDGDEEDVNNLIVAPGAVHAIKTKNEAAENGKQASYSINEYSMQSLNALNEYLNRAEDDMRFALDMPSIKDLNNIPSAKAMRYLNNDLIARCEEKWSDWGPILESLIEFLVDKSDIAYKKLFNKQWKSLNYTIDLKHNYPLPSDEEESKKLAMDEVKNRVRSVKSYIEDFAKDEDSKKSFSEIIEEVKALTEAETSDSFQMGLDGELNNDGGLNE